ncbi:tetratricopeptide repeat protein [Patescibacteria group bacterium]|nr:tetratricopeptide repeat protein [Patescibacteria group bacterium]
MDDSSSLSSMTQKAIDAALDSKWEEALKINKKITKLDPQNVDALNRQAKAYLELGKPGLAQKYYCQVLKFDSYNPIALKNLKIMKSSKPNCIPKERTNCHDRLSPSLFLQEPGKTKMVSLLRVAEPQKLSQTYPGMKVRMIVKNRKITIVDQNESYLGVLPDDISHRLLRLSRGGNKYDLFVKSIRVNNLSIIIKETFRSKKFKNQPSFLDYTNNITSSTNLLTSLDSANSGDTNEADDEEEQQEA